VNLPVPSQYLYSGAYGINTAGRMVGFMQMNVLGRFSVITPHAVLWKDPVSAAIFIGGNQDYPIHRSAAIGINSVGIVVGVVDFKAARGSSWLASTSHCQQW
jgi:hypothetical protein